MSKIKVIAKNRIDGVPGFTPFIAAGTVFECPEASYDQLVAADAISDYEDVEVKVAKAAKADAAPKAKAEAKAGAKADAKAGAPATSEGDDNGLGD